MKPRVPTGELEICKRLTFNFMLINSIFKDFFLHANVHLRSFMLLRRREYYVRVRNQGFIPCTCRAHGQQKPCTLQYVPRIILYKGIENIGKSMRLPGAQVLTSMHPAIKMCILGAGCPLISNTVCLYHESA